MGVYQLSIAPSKHFQFFSGCGPGCGGGGCGEQKTWPISTKQSGGVYSVFIWIILFLWRFVMLKRGQWLIVFYRFGVQFVQQWGAWWRRQNRCQKIKSLELGLTQPVASFWLDRCLSDKVAMMRMLIFKVINDEVGSNIMKSKMKFT